MENKDELVTKGMLEESMGKLQAELTASITTVVITAVVAPLTAAFNKAIDVAITAAVDGLAGLINKSFIDLEKRMALMATKDDVRALQVRVGSVEVKIFSLERKIHDVDAHLLAYSTRWDQDFAGHEVRIRTLEKRVP